MKIIKVNCCHECPFHETEWNRGKQNWDMWCKKFKFLIGNGDGSSLHELPIPKDCELEE